MLVICFNRLKMQSISSNPRQTDLLLAFFYLIMLPAIKNKHLMLSQHEKCLRALIQLGGTTRTVLKCDLQILELMICLKTFTLRMIIQQCLDGSKGWSWNIGNYYPLIGWPYPWHM